MSETTVIVCAVAGTFLLLIVGMIGLLGLFWVYRQIVKTATWLERLQAGIANFCVATATLDMSIKSMVTTVERLAALLETMSTMSKFVEGHSKAAGAMAATILQLRETVLEFKKLITGGASETKQSLQYPTESDADKAYMVAELLASDPSMTVEEASTKAANEQLMRSSMPQLGLG